MQQMPQAHFFEKCFLLESSMLQMHPEAIVIVDEAAASKLEKADYYRWVYDNKPDWQKY